MILHKKELSEFWGLIALSVSCPRFALKQCVDLETHTCTHCTTDKETQISLRKVVFARPYAN